MFGNSHHDQPRVRHHGEQHFAQRLRLLHGKRLAWLPVGRKREASQLYQPLDQLRQTLDFQLLQVFAAQQLLSAQRIESHRRNKGLRESKRRQDVTDLHALEACRHEIGAIRQGVRKIDDPGGNNGPCGIHLPCFMFRNSHLADLDWCVGLS